MEPSVLCIHFVRICIFVFFLKFNGCWQNRNSATRNLWGDSAANSQKYSKYLSSTSFIGNISEENFPQILVVIYLMASQTTSVYNAASSGSSASHPCKHKLCMEAWRQLRLHYLRWTHLFLYVKWANMSRNCQLCCDQTTQPNCGNAQTKTRQHYSCKDLNMELQFHFILVNLLTFGHHLWVRKMIPN